MSTHSLPSRVAPSSRSRSAGRLGREESGDRTHARSPLPSTPRTPSSKSIRPEGYLRPSRDKPDSSRTNSSSTTSSTSGSSFLDRINALSSRTSIEDNQSEPPRRSGGSWASSRRTKAVQGEDEQSDEDRNKGPTALITGHGADLWSHVTTVASKLTVNVSQAWQKSILADGEETPPGDESRLTKAMKAYHLDRARSAADLPSWLFSEHERRVAPKDWNASNPGDYEDRFLPDRDSGPTHRGGLREVYDQAAASSSIPPATRRAPAESGDGGGSRAANRLKAIRDAKRLAKASAEPAPFHSENRRATERSFGGEESGTGRSSQRVGLPSRPGRQ